MKTAFIIAITLLGHFLYAQDDRYYHSMELTILNSQNEPIVDAKVWVDGVQIPYEAQYRCYFKKDTFNYLFDVEVIHADYDTLRYNRQNLSSYASNHTFRDHLWLIRPTEKYYYASSKWLKMPYQPQANKLLVILKSQNLPKHDSLYVRFENEIKKFGLKINKTFTERPTDPAEQWLYDSHDGLSNYIIIQKEDETDFETDFCPELATLRYLDMVQYAGPLITTGTNKYYMTTYLNFITLSRQLMYYDADQIHSFLQQIDKRFYFDEKQKCIVLPPETNESIPQIMEQLRAIGFKEKMSMSMIGMVVLD